MQKQVHIGGGSIFWILQGIWRKYSPLGMSANRGFPKATQDASLSYIGPILGLYWAYIGLVLGLCWAYIGVILGLYWGYINMGTPNRNSSF